MTATIKPAPVRRSVTVKASPARAFEVFTAEFGRWWPKGHHIGKSPMSGGVIEPKAGGRWYEVCEDGSQCNWGKVLAWEPPMRLVLAWQLNAAFQYDPSFFTEVEVRFTPEGEATRVDLEHRNLERFGSDAEKLATSIGADSGWLSILQSYAASVA
ncbi:MAG: SRPBCC family protein [Rhodospirillaceae bacterium]|nr:SRPBCC family protein [Rhodospirillaceae bacterium]